MPQPPNCHEPMNASEAAHELFISFEGFWRGFIERFVEIVSDFVSMVRRPKIGIEVAPFGGRYRDYSVALLMALRMSLNKQVVRQKEPGGGNILLTSAAGHRNVFDLQAVRIRRIEALGRLAGQVVKTVERNSEMSK